MAVTLPARSSGIVECVRYSLEEFTRNPANGDALDVVTPVIERENRDMAEVIHQEIDFNASPTRIYEAFMDSKQHADFTANGAAEISREAGGTFTCHGGAISGRNIELVPGQRIVQAWRVAHWDEGTYSIVRFELEDRNGGTRIILDHAGFPDGEAGHLGEGWHERYWEPLRRYLNPA